MVMPRNNFGDILAPGLNEVFFLAYGEKEMQYESLYKMETSERQYEDDSHITGLGLLSKKTEGANVSTDLAYQGYDQRYIHDTWGLSYSITEELFEDDLYNIMARMPQALARSARATIDTDGAALFNRGFDGTNYADGPDGKELFATDHPLQGPGGTQKNELTNPADLTATSFEQALLDVKATVSDEGIFLNLIPEALVVPPELEWTARKLLNSTLEPGSANNDINPARGMLKLEVKDYLTDPDAWFIRCTEHAVKWFWRVKPSHGQDNDFSTGNGRFKVRARWSRSWSNPWGWFGSPGA